MILVKDWAECEKIGKISKKYVDFAQKKWRLL